MGTAVPMASLAPAVQNMDRFGEALFIVQQIEALEVMCGLEAKNRYSITGASSNPAERTPMGAQSMYIHEESECCQRICCGPNRALTL